MRVLRSVSAVIFAVAFAGCYHATIDTGLTPSGQTVKKEWAHGFIYGLVPPSVVETAAKCPSGVAKVETQLSFLNQLAYVLTGGIYSPMTIEVQCAASSKATAAAGATVTVPRDAKPTEVTSAVQKAVDASVSSGQPSTLVFE